MRSLASVLRAAGLAAVALWIANALVPRARVTVLAGEELADELPRITSSGDGAVEARLDAAPGTQERHWLAALRDAGIDVRWRGDIAPVALETFAAADPAGGAFVLVSASNTASIGDAVGPIDTLSAERGPAVVRVGAARGGIVLTSGGEVARAPVASPIATRRVLVLGAAGWESKFVIAALEEAGWRVDARLRVRPDETVAQGSASPDTASHSAVVLLDTSMTVTGLDAFVRAGGGVVLGGSASRARVAAPLTAWRVARRETAPLGVLPGDTLWRGQSRVLFDGVDTTRAVVLERRDREPVILARRHYAGRVLAVGYDDTWRWRMAGSANGVAEHRDWWSRLVASVAFRPATGSADIATGAAPLAALHASLGPPEPAADASARIPRALLANLLGALALGALLAEWLMRRLRGDR